MRHPEPLADTVLFCESEPACHEVLAHHWPGVPICDDIRSLTGDDIKQVMADAECDGQYGATQQGSTTTRQAKSGVLESQGRNSAPRIVLTAGFPCQDISHAGKRAGITGERSGLWSELCRILSELRPDVALLENVAGLLSGRDVVDGASGPVELSWLGTVLGDLAAIGFDAEWHCIPAAAVGAPHRRDRWWCVARRGVAQPERVRHQAARKSRLPGGEASRRQETTGSIAASDGQPQPHLGLLANGLSDRLARLPEWPEDPHPDIPRVAQGVARRKDKLMGLGNAIVPQVARVILEEICRH